MFSISIEKDLEIKLLMHKDAEDFFQSLEQNKDYLSEFMPRIRENKSVEDTKKVIEIFLKQLVDNNGFRAGIYLNKKFVGIIGLRYIDWINHKTEIMYWIDKEYSGQGLVTKCVKVVLGLSFNNYGLNKVILNASKYNKASQKIAEKCGFKYEGLAREDELLFNGYSDTFQYSILKSEYSEGEER